MQSALGVKPAALEEYVVNPRRRGADLAEVAFGSKRDDHRPRRREVAHDLELLHARVGIPDHKSLVP